MVRRLVSWTCGTNLTRAWIILLSWVVAVGIGSDLWSCKCFYLLTVLRTLHNWLAVLAIWQRHGCILWSHYDTEHCSENGFQGEEEGNLFSIIERERLVAFLWPLHHQNTIACRYISMQPPVGYPLSDPCFYYCELQIKAWNYFLNSETDAAEKLYLLNNNSL